jgi:hypothetical protein
MEDPFMYSNIAVRGTLITATACCLAGLITPAAVAEVADDLECHKCVDQQDLAPRAVTSGEAVIRASSSEIVPLAETADPNDYRVIFSIAQSLDSAIVDNENYQYSLQARMTGIGDDPAAMALAGCRIRLGQDPL